MYLVNYRLRKSLFHKIRKEISFIVVIKTKLLIYEEPLQNLMKQAIKLASGVEQLSQSHSPFSTEGVFN